MYYFWYIYMCPRTRSKTLLQPKDRQTINDTGETSVDETIRDINRLSGEQILLKETREMLLNPIYK